MRDHRNTFFFPSHDFLFIEYGEFESIELTGKISSKIIKSYDDSDVVIRFTSDHKGFANGVKLRILYVHAGNGYILIVLKSLKS